MLQQIVANSEETKQRRNASVLRRKDPWLINDPGGKPRKLVPSFSTQYGDIVALVISSKKNGSALVEFNNRQAAEMAHQLERGLANKPITVKWLGESTHSSTSLPDKKIVEMFPSGNNPVVSDSTFSSFSFNSSNVEGPIKMPMENRDFENLVLHRMRQAEEHRKLAQKIKNEEG
uniref:RRM domain-containing protein n=1 Tax=Timema monikensis TaxID=170555 RepID=A0A7R9HVH1_9NEOP|nr:unnamed protein product [Timema monikensis]